MRASETVVAATWRIFLMLLLPIIVLVGWGGWYLSEARVARDLAALRAEDREA